MDIPLKTYNTARSTASSYAAAENAGALQITDDEFQARHNSRHGSPVPGATDFEVEKMQALGITLQEVRNIFGSGDPNEPCVQPPNKPSMSSQDYSPAMNVLSGLESTCEPFPSMDRDDENKRNGIDDDDALPSSSSPEPAVTEAAVAETPSTPATTPHTCPLPDCPFRDCKEPLQLMSKFSHLRERGQARDAEYRRNDRARGLKWVNQSCCPPEDDDEKQAVLAKLSRLWDKFLFRGAEERSAVAAAAAGKKSSLSSPKPQEQEQQQQQPGLPPDFEAHPYSTMADADASSRSDSNDQQYQVRNRSKSIVDVVRNDNPAVRAWRWVVRKLIIRRRPGRGGSSSGGGGDDSSDGNGNGNGNGNRNNNRGQGGGGGGGGEYIEMMEQNRD